MIHTFKSCGVQAAVDSRDGSVRLLDSLMYSMIPSLPAAADMTAELPTPIRYAFAKYDSQDLRRAYGELYTLYTEEKTEAQKTASLGTYVLLSGEAEDALSTLPSGSSVVAHVQSMEEADRLLQTFPSLFFSFAADASVCSSREDVTALFSFTDTKELLSQTAALFDRGLQRIAGYPKAGTPDAVAAEAYEKLCRELLRMRKKGQLGTFVPFTMEKSHGALALINGGTITRCSRGTFSAVYIESGKMPLNAAFLSSDALIDQCAECAIVLSAKA